MFLVNTESINEYNQNFERNTNQIDNNVNVWDKIKKSLALGIAGLSMTGSLYANDINVQQEHLRSITGNPNIELNQKDIAEKKFKAEVNKQFDNWYNNEKDSSNFTTIDKMKYLMGKTTLSENLSVEETEQMLSGYKDLFNNLKQVITQKEINEFHKNLSVEQKENILADSDKIMRKVIELDENSKGLNKDDKINLLNLQNLAEVVYSDRENILNDNDKILMTSILSKGCEQMENKINDYDKTHKINNVIKDQDKKPFLVEIEDNESGSAHDFIR